MATPAIIRGSIVLMSAALTAACYATCLAEPVGPALLRPGAPRFETIHLFHGRDGASPYAGLIAGNDGSLYGTTYAGGEFGLGTVFQLTPSGGRFNERILYSFEGGLDGAKPNASLLADKSGALYGTTSSGGNGVAANNGLGTVFKLTPQGHAYRESVIYRFKGGNDGATPLSNLVADAEGALYGTTYSGGVSCECGTIFKLLRAGSGYKETVIHAFQDYADGAWPIAGLLSNGKGAFFGTTSYGDDPSYAAYGGAFMIAPASNGYAETVIWSFVYSFGEGGSNPVAGFIADANGSLYSTSPTGGNIYCGNNSYPGCGIVYKLTPSGGGYNETVLYDFTDSPDGAYPEAGLIADERGSLYGTTSAGGSAACSGGCGTVFRFVPAQGQSVTETLLHTFQGGRDGAYPYAGLVRVNGALYGTTLQGGANNAGTVFKIVL